jgi:PAS domain S-box-containing protein
MADDEHEEELLRSAALQNANSILLARRRVEDSLRQKTEELAQQREWFQVTLASIGDAVITTDTESRVTFLNPVAENLTGWKLAEAVGQPLEKVFNIVNEHTRVKAENPIEKALREGCIVALANHTALISKDGKETAIEDSAAPIKNSAGKIIGAVMVFHDVTEQRRAQESVGLNERFNRAIIESSRDCMKTLSLEGTFIWLSGAAQKILCVTDVNELLGKSWVDLWSGEDRLAAQAAVTAAARGDMGDFVGYMKVGGKDKWWNVVVTPILDTDGRPEKLLAVSRDVTERKKSDEALRRSEEELRALADSMSQLAWMAEPDGNLFWYNRRWYDYTGTTLEEMKGWGWQKVHDPILLPSVIARWTEAIHLGKSFEMEFPLRGVDGTFRRFLTRANPIYDVEGKVARWFGTNTDIEFSKLAEEKITTALDTAEQANKTKDHFIAALSHELRTPLTPVLALLSNFSEDTTISKAAAADLETIRRNVELEVRLIDDLLDLTRVTRGKLDLRYHHTQVSQIVDDAINTCLSDLNTKHVLLVREIKNPDQMIFVDSTRITQILWNLLKNSIKFTPQDGTITIRSYSSSYGDSNKITIEVEDNGIGIEPEHIKRVFDAFEQGDPAITRQFGGLGLGLAISRAIAESHHGTLTAISAGHGRGSTFTLTIPMGEEIREVNAGPAINPPAATAPQNAGRAKPALRILLVEDHADTANSLGALLRRRGFLVSITTNVADALKLAAMESFDLLISDLGLPDATGYECIKKIRQLQPIPGIALSGFGMEEDIQKSHTAGFSEHLVKPIRVTQLEEAIARIMGNR